MSELVIREIFKTAGIEPGGLLHRLGRLLFGRLARGVSKFGLEVNRRIDEDSINEAAHFLISYVSHPPRVVGNEHVPREGPLLVVANHPGTVDAAGIIAALPRQDIRIIAGYTFFVEQMDHLARHMIFRHLDAPSQVHVVRAAVRHLSEGGCLMLFPAGKIEPDPSILPGAADAMDEWFRSPELFLRQVPETTVQPVIVSHVLLLKFVNHIIARTRKDPYTRLRTAEMLQIIYQVIWRNRYMLSPRVTFGRPFNYQDLVDRAGDRRPFNLLIDRAKVLLAEHVASFDEGHPPLEMPSNQPLSQT